MVPLCARWHPWTTTPTTLKPLLLRPKAASTPSTPYVLLSILLGAIFGVLYCYKSRWTWYVFLMPDRMPSFVRLSILLRTTCFFFFIKHKVFVFSRNHRGESSSTRIYCLKRSNPRVIPTLLWYLLFARKARYKESISGIAFIIVIYVRLHYKLDQTQESDVFEWKIDTPYVLAWRA